MNRTVVWLLFLVPVLAWVPNPCNGAVPGYYYTSQSFDVSIYDRGASVFVAQSASLYCYEGSLDQVEIALPYGAEEIPGLEDTLLVQTDTARELDADVERRANVTIIRVTLPERIYQGEDQVIIAKSPLTDSRRAAEPPWVIVSSAGRAGTLSSYSVPPCSRRRLRNL